MCGEHYFWRRLWKSPLSSLGETRFRISCWQHYLSFHIPAFIFLDWFLKPSIHSYACWNGYSKFVIVNPIVNIIPYSDFHSSRILRCSLFSLRGSLAGCQLESAAKLSPALEFLLTLLANLLPELFFVELFCKHFHGIIIKWWPGCRSNFHLNCAGFGFG